MSKWRGSGCYPFWTPTALRGWMHTLLRITTRITAARPGYPAAIQPARVLRSHQLSPLSDVRRGGVTWNVLNAAGDGPEGDVNANSLSFRMSCGGFVYAHGGDIYAPNQRRIALDHPEWVPADVYHGNHHLFGTMDISYLRRCNPVLFLAQVNAHCYGKGDHHDHFIPEVESYLYAHQGRLRETLRAFETGSATLRVMKDGSFTYETFREFDRAREV